MNRLTSTGEFRSAVGAVPGDVYPTKEPVPGLGEEAWLHAVGWRKEKS